MYYEEQHCSIFITINRYDHQHIEGTLNRLLEEDYNRLPLDRREVLSRVISELQSSLSIEDLYKGFLRLSSTKKQFNFLMLLEQEKQLDILKLLNVEHLEQGIVFLIRITSLNSSFDETISIQTLSSILSILPETFCNHHDYSGQLQLKFTFLDRLTKEYLQHIIKTSGNFIGILNVVPRDCWNYFFIKFDNKFLKSKINNFGDVDFILKNWPKGQQEYIKNIEELEKITVFRKYLNKQVKRYSSTRKSFFKPKTNKKDQALIFKRLSNSSSSSTAMEETHISRPIQSARSTRSIIYSI